MYIILHGMLTACDGMHVCVLQEGILLSTAQPEWPLLCVQRRGAALYTTGTKNVTIVDSMFANNTAKVFPSLHCCHVEDSMPRRVYHAAWRSGAVQVACHVGKD